MKPLSKSIGFAIFLFLLDAFFLGTFYMAVLAFFYVVVGPMPRALDAYYKKDFPAVAYYVKKAGIYSLMIVLVIAAYNGNNALARSRTLQLAGLAKAYKEKHGFYPKRLTHLIPEFTKRIPPPKISISPEFTFRYNSSETGAYIMYTILPMGCFQYYRMEEGKEDYWDGHCL